LKVASKATANKGLLMRFTRFCSLLTLLTGVLLLAGGVLAQDIAANLTRAFPAPSWRQNGPNFVCVADSCGKGSLVAMMPGKGNVEARIRSGELDETWLRQTAANFVQAGKGDITMLETKRHVGSGVPSLSGFYRCKCGHQVKHVAFQILGSGDTYIMFLSMAVSANAARQNPRKIGTAITGT
jgi:hypothetical protein